MDSNVLDGWSEVVDDLIARKPKVVDAEAQNVQPVVSNDDCEGK